MCSFFHVHLMRDMMPSESVKFHRNVIRISYVWLLIFNSGKHQSKLNYLYEWLSLSLRTQICIRYADLICMCVVLDRAASNTNTHKTLRWSDDRAQRDREDLLPKRAYTTHSRILINQGIAKFLVVNVFGERWATRMQSNFKQTLVPTSKLNELIHPSLNWVIHFQFICCSQILGKSSGTVTHRVNALAFIAAETYQRFPRCRWRRKAAAFKHACRRRATFHFRIKWGIYKWTDGETDDRLNGILGRIIHYTKAIRTRTSAQI